METKRRVNIYGDSLMRGTVLDEKGRYHATVSRYLPVFERDYGLSIRNRARFGDTVTEGAAVLEKDLSAGMGCDAALLEFGGNDCSFNWRAVAENPRGNYAPLTPIDAFTATLERMIGALRGAGATPVLMTLPPIDAERYLRHIGPDERSRGNILQWLGDCQRIYRFHEMYSAAIGKLAQQKGVSLIDARGGFLSLRNALGLIGPDGIHLREEGYAVVADAALTHLRGGRAR